MTLFYTYGHSFGDVIGTRSGGDMSTYDTTMSIDGHY